MPSLLDFAACGLVAGWIGSVFFTKNKRLELTINIARDPDWDIYQRIKNALAKKPTVLALELIGMGRLEPDAMLSIHDLLLRRPPSMSIEVNVKTNLSEVSLIFLLHAEKIEIRKGAWLHVIPIDDSGDRSEEEDGSMFSFFRSNDYPTCTLDQIALYDILNQHLPLKEFYQKKIPLEETLKEFGLIRNQQQDEELARMLGGRTH